MPSSTLGLLVKYFPPSRRISGVIGFLAPLARHLGKILDLQIFTSRIPGAPEREATDTYTIHRVGWPFPISAGRAVKSLGPDVVLTVSSMYQRRRAALYFGAAHLASMASGVPRRSMFYQATNPAAGSDRMYARLLGSYDIVLCASPQMGTDFSGFSQRLELLLPAVDTRALARVPSATATGFRVGFVNHLNRVKGFDLALEIFRRLEQFIPNAEFVIAGLGELEHAVPEVIGSHRIDRYGWLTDEDRLALIRSCDVMVLPFRTGVSVLGLSQTVLECMAMGVVVVGSRTASIAPIIDHGVDGFLVDTPDEAVSAILTVYQNASVMRYTGEAAQQKMREFFDVTERARTLAGWVDQLAAHS